MEITATDDIEKIMKRNEDSLRNLWDVKCIDIRAMGVPEGEKEVKEKGAEKILEEVTAENFLNMGKDFLNQVQEVQRVPGRINPRRNTLRHMVIKLTKIKSQR